MDDSLIQGQHATNSTRWIEDATARAFALARRTLVAHRAEAVCAGLLLLMAVNLFTAMWHKAVTNDEVVHIPSGYYYLVTENFQINNEHPPLIKMWAALPLLFIQPNEPHPNQAAKENFSERTWSYDMGFWEANRARFETIAFWPRVMMVPLALALGILIFIYARKLFGERAAVLAVALYSFEPTILAHGRIVHTDVPVALAYLLFFYALHLYLEIPTWKRAAWLGLATSIALLTKFSMVITLPILATVALLMFWRNERWKLPRARIAGHAALVLVIALFAVNAAYKFQRPPVSASDASWVAAQSAPHYQQLMTGFSLGSHFLPTYFMFGIYNVLMHNSGGHPTSLLGMQSDSGWWYYFPIAFALKTTLPFLLITIAALAWSLYRLLVKRDERFLALIIPLTIYTAISLTSHINIGVRHFLPTFPFIIIMGGALLDRVLETRARWKHVALAIVALSLGWIIFEAARAYPDYTPYMNQLAASRPHWHYLSDSNVEWGDDVNALAAYLRARGETRVGAALSGGWLTLRFYGVEYVDLVGTPSAQKLPEPRYTAIGASFLNGSTVFLSSERIPNYTNEQRTNFFADYRNRQPEAVFGNSIYLYREK